MKNKQSRSRPAIDGGKGALIMEMNIFSTAEKRRNFICNNQSGIYTGVNVEGEAVVVILQQSGGMDVKVQHENKPNWWEVLEYDADGFHVSTSYEPVADTGKGNYNG